MLVAHFSLFCAVVVFGFNPDSYTVDESAGTVNIGVEFLMGSFGTALISVQLTLSTLDGTANGNTEEPMVDTCLGVKGASGDGDVCEGLLYTQPMAISVATCASTYFFIHIRSYTFSS